jgi:hypothetical protein
VLGNAHHVAALVLLQSTDTVTYTDDTAAAAATAGEEAGSTASYIRRQVSLKAHLLSFGCHSASECKYRGRHPVTQLILYQQGSCNVELALANRPASN